MFLRFLLCAVFFFSFATPVIAQQDELPDPGILPTSPWYRFELFFEQIGEFITIDKTAKAERLLMHAEERLAELTALLEEKKHEKAQEILTSYQASADGAASITDEAEQNGENVEDLRTKIQEVTLKHQTVLLEVYEKVPESAKPAIEGAMENSLKGQRSAVEAVSKEKKEDVRERIEEIRQQGEKTVDTLQEEGKPVPSIAIPEGKSGQTPPDNANEKRSVIPGKPDHAVQQLEIPNVKAVEKIPEVLDGKLPL